MLRRVIQGWLGRAGYVLTRTPVEGSLEREIQRVLRDLQIDCVVDIGGHEGRFARSVRRLGFGGRILSFEPAAAAFARLAAAAANDSNWDVYDLALSDRPGRARLHMYAEHTELSSLHGPSVYGEAFGMTPAGSVDVDTATLDSVASEQGLDPRTCFVKIDTQGHDGAVIAGGASFLRGVAALLTEMPTIGLYDGASSMAELLELTAGIDLRLVGLFPVHVPREELFPVEFDALFARNDR